MPVIDQASNDPRSEHAPVKEAWWDSPLGNARVAAFLAGRLLNQLNWEFQIRTLFHPYNDDDVDAVIDKLVAVSYHLLGVGQNTIEQDIRHVQQSVPAAYDNEETAEMVDGFLFPFCDPLALEAPEQSYEDFCYGLVSPCIAAVARLRKTFEQDLPKTDRAESVSLDLFAFFQLGECLDQAIRRPDLYNFVSRKPETAAPANTNETEQAILGETEPFAGYSDSDYESLGYRRLPNGGWRKPRKYAVYRPAPGELPLEGSWQEKVLLAAERAGIPTITLEKMDLSQLPQERRHQRAKTCSKLIWGHLTDPKPPEILPEWDQERRELRFDGQVVRRYGKDKAESQAAILRAFEREGWPARIVCPDRLSVTQVRSAIKNFNRSRDACVMRLGGDGSGTAITWKAEPESASS